MPLQDKPLAGSADRSPGKTPEAAQSSQLKAQLLRRRTVTRDTFPLPGVDTAQSHYPWRVMGYGVGL